MTSLTQLNLSLFSREALRDLNDSHQLHRTLMQLTVAPEVANGATQARAEAGLLHRIEDVGDSPSVLVQSARPCDVSRLPEGYLASDSRTGVPAFRTLALDDVLNGVVPGSMVRYTLVAAPVLARKSGKDDRARGKKLPLTNPVEVEAWWRRQTRHTGLRLEVPEGELSVRVDRAVVPRGRKNPGQVIRHRASSIRGIARVEDPAALRGVITRGIGPGKAYGCGLLTVIPMR